MNSHTDGTAAKPGTRGRKLIALAVLLAGLTAASLLLPVKDYILAALEWTQGLGFWGPFVMIALYVIACLLMLPGSIITLAAGFLFGLPLGAVTVSAGSTLGATAAFLVGRTFARDWVRKKVAGRPKFDAIDRAVGQQGFKVVLLTRLSPVFPFNIQNYAYGLTGLTLGKYMLASWLGMIPGTIAYVYIGSGLRSLTEAAAGETERGWAQQAFFWGGMAATLAVVAVVTRIARRAMAEAVLDESGAQHAGAPRHDGAAGPPRRG